MIKAEQIPDVVRDAYLAEEDRTGSVEASIAAALNAWPGMVEHPDQGVYRKMHGITHLILPLQESSDG